MSVTHIPGISNKEADKQYMILDDAREREGKPRARAYLLPVSISF